MSTYQVRSLEEADFIVKQHEKKTKTSYALLRSTKNFGCVDVPGCNNEEQEVRFDTVGVPYCGVPFFVAGLKILQCQSYKEKGSKALSKKKEIKIELPGSCASVINSPLDEQAAPTELTSRTLPPRKKKKLTGGRAPRSSCTATVILKEVIYYPEFQLLEHSRNNRLGVARQLKEVLRNRSPVQKDRIIYVTVPSHSDHFGHPVGQIVSKKIYLKNDYYGPVATTTGTQSSHTTGDSPTKRLYFPVKEEKSPTLSSDLILGLPMACFEDPVKSPAPEDVLQGKAKEVRDLLQSVMAFTYKCTDRETMEQLRQDLVALKQRCLERPKLNDRRPAQQQQQQQLALPDAGKREQQQQQAVTVQTQPQIVLLKQSKPPQPQHNQQQQQQPQQQQILQQQIVPRVVSGPRPLRLKGQQPQQQQQQQSILQVQQMENDPSTLSITINPVGAVASSSSLVSLSGASLSALPSVTSTVAGLSSGPLCTPSFTNIAGNALHAMPIASIPTVSIAGNASSLPITTLPSFPTVVVPSAALQPSNVTLAIPAGSFSALSGALPAFSNGSSFPARSIASAASISLGSISTLQTGVLPSLQCSATSLSSIVAPVLSDIIMAPAAQSAAVSNSPSLSSFTSGSQTATAQRVLTSVSTNKTFMSTNNRNVNNSNAFSLNVSQNDITSSASPTSLNSVSAGTILRNMGVTCLASPSSKNSDSSQMSPVGATSVTVCTSVDGSPLSSGAGGGKCTWTVAAAVSQHVTSTSDVTCTRGSTSKPHSAASLKKSSLMQDQAPSGLRESYDQQRQLRPGLASDDQRTDLIQAVAPEHTPSELKTSSAKPGGPSDSGNNQETSIFIEAMEAILNSHM